jgi:hypothetical protein
MLKVVGHENLYRDPKSGAIINNQPILEKNTFQENFHQVKVEVDVLKSELQEIKSLLKILIDNK